MSDPSAPPPAESTLSKLLPWIVLLLSALGLFYFVEKGCGAPPNADKEKTEMPKDSIKMDSMKTDSMPHDSMR